MGFFNNWPYSNLHNLNLDWIISEIKSLKELSVNIWERVKPVDESGTITSAQAYTKAVEAADTANSAKSESGIAKTLANSANQTANTAKQTADTAQQTADTATGKADNAAADAERATKDADAAIEVSATALNTTNRTSDRLDTHVNNHDNPHMVTADQVGAVPGQNYASGYRVRSGSNEREVWLQYLHNDDLVNALSLFADRSALSKPLTLNSGGTGAANATGAVENLGLRRKRDVDTTGYTYDAWLATARDQIWRALDANDVFACGDIAWDGVNAGLYMATRVKNEGVYKYLVAFVYAPESADNTSLVPQIWYNNDVEWRKIVLSTK